MKFYRGSSEIIDVVIDDKTKLQQTLQDKDLIQASFVLDSCFNFQIGDYVYWRNKQYTVFKQPSIKKTLSNKFQYNFDLESDQYRLLDALYMLDGISDFYLVGDVQKFANLIIANLNRLSGEGYYQLGVFPETSTKNLNFQDTNCLLVLQQIADEFDIEYYFSDDGRTINFSEQSGVDTGLSFEFKNGLRNIERQKVTDKNIITRLYAFGSERNIPSDYGTTKLKIEAIENNTDVFGVIEGVANFEDIYPHREGVVSNVYEDNILRFSDTSLDFNINDQLIEGVVAKVTFNSGYLAGREFEITQYIHSSNIFTIIPYSDENGFEFPSNNLKIKSGDTYVLHDLNMPDEYIEKAELELLQSATEYLEENSLPNVIYNIQPDYVYLRKNLIQLNIGDVIEVKDDDFGITYSTRILSINQSIANPYKYTISTGDKATIGYITQVRNNQISLANDIRVEKEDRTIQYNRTRRSLKNIDELKEAVFDPDGYFDTEKIKPLSIETGMLSVGSKGQQFNVRNLLIEANYQGNENLIKCGNGVLAHFTIDAESVKEWNVTGNIFTLEDASSYYYIYIKCSRLTNTGVFEISTEQHLTESVNYYYFMLGVLHSSIDGVRGVNLTYGQTSINGKFITTGKIQSVDGFNYFDLDGNKFNLGNEYSGIDWNITNENKLTIRGGLVQSPSGSISPITVYKGPWEYNEVYYYGDEVTHEGSTYIYINENETEGNSPISKEYWVASAQSGNAIKTVYKRHSNNFIAEGFIEEVFVSSVYKPKDVNHEGWSEQPLTGSEPMWMSKCIIDSYGEIVENWSEPIKITGEKGDDGNSGPALVFRGGFDNEKEYFTTDDRQDVVKYEGSYYKYTGTSGVALEWSDNNWKDFGAQFESVATNTLLAENANIGDWIIKDGKISSQEEVSNQPKMQLDGVKGRMVMRGLTGDDDFRGLSEIKDEGIFIESEGDNFRNAIYNSTWISGNATIVKNSHYDDGTGGNLLAAVYGKAINTNSNPSRTFGGYFVKLMARGLYTKIQRETDDSAYYMEETDVTVICKHESAPSGKYVWLPLVNVQERGKIVIIKAHGENVVIIDRGDYKIDDLDYLTVSNQTIRLQFDGFDWWTI